MRLADQGLLKCVTRLAMESFGDAYPDVILALKAAWNNDDVELHEAAWAALQQLGKFNVEQLMGRAKNEVRTQDWLSARIRIPVSPLKSTET